MTAFALEIIENVYHGLEICTDWCKNCILYYLWQVFFLYAEKWSGHGLTSRCGSCAYGYLRKATIVAFVTRMRLMPRIS